MPLFSQLREHTTPAALGASLLVAAGITLSTVRAGPDGALASTGGYTWSLLLWYLPALVILIWFVRRRNQTIQHPAFWTTFVILLAIGFALDYFFAHAFFDFPNEAAVLLPSAPALGGRVPLEEYLFYLGGFLFILLCYIWCDEAFLGRYNVPDYRAAWLQGSRRRVVEFDAFSLTLAIVFVSAGWIYKQAVAYGDYAGGFPGYLAYLAGIGMAPAVGLFRATKRFINWPAFTIAFLAVVAVALLWEATLAARLQWWTYQPSQMMGLLIAAWYDLPVEAVLVWLAATFTTVIIYEAVKVWQASGGHVPRGVPRVVRRSLVKWYDIEPDIPPREA